MKRYAQVGLVVLVLGAAMMACTLPWLDPASGSSMWGQATLTYAAGEWYAQLTAMAAP